MKQPDSASKTIFSISKLNRLARSILESEIGQIWVNAEISNFVAASSGHWYFTLKDARAQVRAAMFKGANRRVAVRPKEGDKILARANLSLYEPRGDYQLIVDYIEPEGEGRLKQQFEQLKITLTAEGLFDPGNKQPIPHSARKIGVITSASGAALHDILTVLQRRNPTVEVIVYPSQVQGEQAARQLCHAIELANQRNEVEVLLLSRGGGSLEDLWCFNDETLARAIHASRLPIVSAVGHEVDVTIADFVADLRAPTPSAAAEQVSQDCAVLRDRLEILQHRITQATVARLKQYTQQFSNLNHRLHQTHPQTRLMQQSQKLDQLTLAMHQAMRHQLDRKLQQHQTLANRLVTSAPSRQIAHFQERTRAAEARLQRGMQTFLSTASQRLSGAAQLLESVSPLATLSRGYTISLHKDKVVRSVSQVSAGEEIITRLADGKVVSQVTHTESD